MADSETVLDTSGDWTLVRRDNGVLEARKPVPFEGVLRYSTERRGYVSYRKQSQFNLTEREVLDRYESKTGRSVDLNRVENSEEVTA